MANNYTQFSNVIAENLTEEEVAWLVRYLPLRETYMERKGDWVNNGLEVDGDTLLAIAEESGDIQETVEASQAFFKKWRPQAVGEISWADTCSKMRIGEFGGGLVVFSAISDRWFPDWNEVAKAYAEIKAEVEAS